MGSRDPGMNDQRLSFSALSELSAIVVGLLQRSTVRAEGALFTSGSIDCEFHASTGSPIRIGVIVDLRDHGGDVVLPARLVCRIDHPRDHGMRIRRSARE